MQLVQCTATPTGGGRQKNSCNARALQVGGRGVLPRMRSLPKERNSCNTQPQWRGAMGSGTHVIQCLTAWGHQAMQFMQYTAILPGRSVQWKSCNALPHCPGALGGGTAAKHSLTASGLWAVQTLQYTASLHGGSGQWNSCNTLPHYWDVVSGQCNFCNPIPHRPGVVGNATPAMRGPTIWGNGESPGGGRCLKSGTPET